MKERSRGQSAALGQDADRVTTRGSRIIAAGGRVGAAALVKKGRRPHGRHRRHKAARRILDHEAMGGDADTAQSKLRLRYVRDVHVPNSRAVVAEDVLGLAPVVCAELPRLDAAGDPVQHGPVLPNELHAVGVSALGVEVVALRGVPEGDDNVGYDAVDEVGGVAGGAEVHSLKEAALSKHAGKVGGDCRIWKGVSGFSRLLGGVARPPLPVVRVLDRPVFEMIFCARVGDEIALLLQQEAAHRPVLWRAQRAREAPPPHSRVGSHAAPAGADSLAREQVFDGEVLGDVNEQVKMQQQPHDFDILHRRSRKDKAVNFHLCGANRAFKIEYFGTSGVL
ncbi:hypothetical protein nvc1_150 [Namao virus]|nr:hypothetical protein nvc1_150 [Namao virus]